MTEPTYDLAAEVAARVVDELSNLHDCKAVVFGRILFAVLDALREAERRIFEANTAPSEN
jgi:hypothetical protein